MTRTKKLEFNTETVHSMTRLIHDWFLVHRGSEEEVSARDPVGDVIEIKGSWDLGDLADKVLKGVNVDLVVE